jgi:hypothetical protein
MEDLRPAIEEALDESEAGRGVETQPDRASNQASAPANSGETLKFCGRCRLIQTASGTWEDLANYLQHRDRAMVTLSLCPTCQEILAHEGQRQPHLT